MGSSARVWVRRVYDPPTRNDGHRVLVDRLWPRGVSKADAAVDEWRRDLSPSDDLRQWFDHDPRRWDEFCRRYRGELDGSRGSGDGDAAGSGSSGPDVDDPGSALADLVARARRGRITLVYAARDQDHNNAVALREMIVERLDRAGES